MFAEYNSLVRKSADMQNNTRDHTVALLGLVSPGAATNGVTLWTFVSHRPLKSDDLFSLASVSSPLPPSPPSNVVSPVFFANSASKN